LDIASVSLTVPPKALMNPANFTVIGDVTGSGLERGYLELSWSYPDQTVNGE
jgi:hypothetical protein